MKKQELQIKFSDPLDEIHKKLDRFFYLLFTVGIVFIITLVVMVGTLLIDSFHINSVTYKEYSQKTESIESTQKINRELLKQNKKNQEIIIDLQGQILKK